MNLNKVTGDRQSQSKTTVLASRTAVGLTKTIKDVWEKLPTYSSTAISDCDFYRRALLSHQQRNRPTTVRKLDRVGHEVPDHLLKSICVSRDHCRSAIELRFNANSFGIRGRTHNID